jgi:hypothetical protein
MKLKQKPRIKNRFSLFYSPNGITFQVPQTALGDELLHTKVKKGDVVTVAFENYSRKSIPVNPKITRIRKDMTWENVLHEFVKQHQSVKRGI